ncbi:MAG: O-antigen ligase family protein, partial [Chloroflexi bacterium]|nr:O-antigen ligase family protein [Chloroflexota bacterium]
GWRAVEHWLTALVTLGLVLSLAALYQYFFIGVVEETGGVRRLLAIYHSPNALALFLGRILPVALVLLLGGALVTPWQRILYTASALCLAAVLWLTFSRGAWLAVAVSLAAVVLWQGRGKLVALGSAAAGLAVAGLAFTGGLGRVLSGATERQRLWVWESAVQMIRDHPWLGVGLDNFLYQYRERYRLPEAWAEPDISHPHNIVLDFWTRLGLPGVIALAWLQLRFWSNALASLRRATEQRQRILILALMAAMTETLVHGLVDNSFFLIDLAILFWLIYALAQAPKRESA